jgi:hypothetical protein
MSKRLDQEREQKLTPRRVAYAIEQLEKTGKVTDIQSGFGGSISFTYKGNKGMFWAYTGWFTCKGLVANRGIQHLLEQLK